MSLLKMKCGIGDEQDHQNRPKCNPKSEGPIPVEVAGQDRIERKGSVNPEGSSYKNRETV